MRWSFVVSEFFCWIVGLRPNHLCQLKRKPCYSAFVWKQQLALMICLLNDVPFRPEKCLNHGSFFLTLLISIRSWVCLLDSFSRLANMWPFRGHPYAYWNRRFFGCPSGRLSHALKASARSLLGGPSGFLDCWNPQLCSWLARLDYPPRSPRADRSTSLG